MVSQFFHIFGLISIAYVSAPLISCALVPSSNKRYISFSSCSSITFVLRGREGEHSLQEPDYSLQRIYLMIDYFGI